MEWIHDAMMKAKALGEEITSKEWEYARRCLLKVCSVDVDVCICQCKYKGVSNVFGCTNIRSLGYTGSYIQLHVF